MAIAYYLKDELRMFWEQETWGDAMEFLEDWCRRAQTSGIRLLQQFARTLQGHRSGLLAWYHHPISTGPLEGVNNKIKLLQRRAYIARHGEAEGLSSLWVEVDGNRPASAASSGLGTPRDQTGDHRIPAASTGLRLRHNHLWTAASGSSDRSVRSASHRVHRDVDGTFSTE
ncbi:transposase [Planctomicrobium sp. SH661]|uniref:transposase n=1 Tax=Planctomicrobium sp. SH661 TaxID=3448124 RepID=UPI003F5BA4AE